jgi:hypothetical protein
MRVIYRPGTPVILGRISIRILAGKVLVRPRETIIHPFLQSAEVEIFEIAVQWCISISFPVIFVLVRLEPFPKEVSCMSKSIEDHVAEVGR